MSSVNSHTSDAYDKLKENAITVMKSYYVASERLNLHNTFSQWSLSLLSLGLIIIPLLTVTKIKLHYSQNIIDCVSISLAVTVLALSILIGANNYAVRKEKMYQAGLEFNRLVRDMRYFEADANRMSQYKNFSCCYGNILSKYENVKDIDHLKGQSNISRNRPVSIVSFCQMLKYWCLLAFEMVIYFVPIISEFGFIIFLVK